MLRDTLETFGSLSRRPRGNSPAERMESFYGPIAERYDRQRAILLHGREHFARLLPLRPGMEIAEIGAGTGWLCACLASRLRQCPLRSYHLVDCSAAMLTVASRRVAGLGLAAAALHHADATHWRAPRPLDMVVFSYSLSMVDEWRECLGNAISQLRPGGTVALIDFHVTPRHPLWCRWMWPRLFRQDGVHLRPELLPELTRLLEPRLRREYRSRLPLLRLPRPVLIFLGQVRS